MKKFLLTVFAIIAFPYIASAQELRGVWVSTVANLDYPLSPTTNSEELKKQADKIISDCADLGFNAVFLQVRPSGDALYKSELYPWSVYLTGTQGTPPDDGFDPLEYWCEIAHNNGIELHAWINPYRIATSENITLSSDNIAVTHPEWTVKCNGGLYLDPGVPQVREYVINGAAEIVENYDVDGIHLDDYFYPSKDFNDENSYLPYKSSMTLADWRRNNTYLLIKNMGETVRSENVRFGVSPCGIWANKGTMDNGSATNGKSAYFDMYADTLRWAKENIIDYIAPQIYWYNGYAPADYAVLTDWWSSELSQCETDLYIGLADYRLDEFGGDVTSPWYGGAEIERQMHANSQNPDIDGEIHFRYGSVVSHIDLYDKIKTEYAVKSENEGGFCLYIYYDRFGEVMYMKRSVEFSVSECKNNAPKLCSYAIAHHTKNGKFKREKVGL